MSNLILPVFMLKKSDTDNYNNVFWGGDEFQH